MTTNVTKMPSPVREKNRVVVRLNGDEKYMLYKYVVEHYCLAQEGDLYRFRVPPATVAQEVNKNFKSLFPGKMISAYHVKDSVEEVIDWQVRMNKLPPVPIETAELEQLKIYKTKSMKEIEELKEVIRQKDRDIYTLRTELERLKKIPTDAPMKLEKIKQILGS